jgi:hypothetical protein
LFKKCRYSHFYEADERFDVNQSSVAGAGAGAVEIPPPVVHQSVPGKWRKVSNRNETFAGKLKEQFERVSIAVTSIDTSDISPSS